MNILKDLTPTKRYVTSDIEFARDLMFGGGDYPIFDETYRETLETKMVKHYYMYAPGFDSIEEFAFHVNNYMNEVMVEFNPKYLALAELEPYANADWSRRFTNTVQSTEDVETTSNGLSETENKINDLTTGSRNDSDKSVVTGNDNTTTTDEGTKDITSNQNESGSVKKESTVNNTNSSNETGSTSEIGTTRDVTATTNNSGTLATELTTGTDTTTKTGTDTTAKSGNSATEVTGSKDVTLTKTGTVTNETAVTEHVDVTKGGTSSSSKNGTVNKVMGARVESNYTFPTSESLSNTHGSSATKFSDHTDSENYSGFGESGTTTGMESTDKRGNNDKTETFNTTDLTDEDSTTGTDVTSSENSTVTHNTTSELNRNINVATNAETTETGSNTKDGNSDVKGTSTKNLTGQSEETLTGKDTTLNERALTEAVVSKSDNKKLNVYDSSTTNTLTRSENSELNRDQTGKKTDTNNRTDQTSFSSSKEYVEHITGLQRSKSSLFVEYVNAIQNLDVQIIEGARDLFMLVF